MFGFKMLEKVIGWVTIRSETVRQGLAEALGTFLLMLFGLGSVAQVVLGQKNFGEYLSINLGFGFGAMLGIHAAGGISGAHMNASITFANCLIGRLPWYKFPAYVIGQFVGSFLAASTVFVMYYEALQDYTGGNLTITGPTATAGIFSTYPAPYVSLLGGFFNEVRPAQLSFIFSFRAANCWWWVPIVAPMLGSLVGVFIYNILIDFHNRSQKELELEPSQNDKYIKHDLEAGGTPEIRL
ncbi:hypothetical protein JD844_008128 [Phrynosoma platyrhinos]|uniref:Aquaporin-7 n=1 Tax=Phrynosoma platyrhinos TaxID=52577 RepID=A0ABQ7TEE7_PHRPL|nr:hypothetical protein JD844_008128 [Phrynosoma platyrhinos]